MDSSVHFWTVGIFGTRVMWILKKSEPIKAISKREYKTKITNLLLFQ